MPNRRRSSLARKKGDALHVESLEPRHLLSGVSVSITEFMAANSSTLVDFEGDAADWIELQNMSAAPIDLAGWHLTDDPNRLTKWQFPDVDAAELDAGAYLVVFASDKSGEPGVPIDELHTNFKLAKDGEYLALVMPDGVTIAHAYAPQFPPQLDDVSYGVSEIIVLSDTLVSDDASARYAIPDDDSLDAAWRDVGFADDDWHVGPLAVGYDTSSAAARYALVDIGEVGQRVEIGAQATSSSGNGVNLQPVDQVADDGDAFTVAIDNRAPDGAPVGRIDWRDRGDGSSASLVALGEDLAKSNDGMVHVTLGSLPAGVYDVVSYHIDPGFDQSEQIRVFVTDAAGVNVEQPGVGNADVDAGGAGGLTTGLVASTRTEFRIVSNGVDEVHLYFDGRAASDTEVPLNGFELRRQGSLYEGLIETDVEGEMLGLGSSAYLRIPFAAAAESSYTS
ncbi:MAG: lamin tail domain-containing protein, partial [Planctomycetota bacterium]